MGSKKKADKKPFKKSKPKTKPDSSLMTEVEKSNPDFVKWLRNRKSNKE